MAQLDVSDVLLDPLLADRVIVVRRTETVNGYGESVITAEQFRAICVITSASDESLERAPNPDMEYMVRSITIVTKFPVRGPAPGYQPDLIIWQGDQFVIDKVAPYPNYGAGFVEAEATSIDYIDLPPLPAYQATGEMLFYAPANTALIGVV